MIDDIRKFMNEKRVVYDHGVDQKNFKWSGKTTLKKVELDILPKYIIDNVEKYDKWLE